MSHEHLSDSPLNMLLGDTVRSIERDCTAGLWGLSFVSDRRLWAVERAARFFGVERNPLTWLIGQRVVAIFASGRRARLRFSSGACLEIDMAQPTIDSAVPRLFLSDRGAGFRWG